MKVLTGKKTTALLPLESPELREVMEEVAKITAEGWLGFEKRLQRHENRRRMQLVRKLRRMGVVVEVV